MIYSVNRILARLLASKANIKRLISAEPNKNTALVDKFGRFHNYLRMSLTEKCNLRCKYCMPEEGVKLTSRANLMSLEERKKVLSVFAHLGVTKLRFTGGEPTLSKDLVELVRFAKHLGMYSIGITTNGIQVGPRVLDGLAAAGLTSINVSVDSLDSAKFAAITRRDAKGLLKALATLYGSVSRGLSTKLNCVLMRGTNDDELARFVEITREQPIDCRFIEVMPFDGNEWRPATLMGYLEAIELLRAQGSAVELDTGVDRPARDPHDTTKWYRAEGHLGRVGFITSMSKHFCGGCNRLRITADGKLKVCLFGSAEMSLRDLMRQEGMSEAQLVDRIEDAVKAKHAALGGHASPEALAQSANRPMILIGG